MTADSAPGRWHKWELLGLLSLAFFFHQGDRAIFGVVLAEIRADLRLTDSQLGMVGSVMFLTLAMLMPLAGYAGDRWPKKWIITIGLTFWSAATLCTGFVEGLLGLVLLRGLALAAGESVYAPAAYALLAKYHRTTRSLAMSVHQAAMYLGVMTSGFLGGWLAQVWGWRAAFYGFGAGGIVLGMICVWRLRDPAPQNIGAAMATPRMSEALGAIFRVRTALLLTVGFTAIVFVNNAYVVWAPEFLRQKTGIPMAQAGAYAMFYHHLAALGGVLIGGLVSDRWVRSRPTVRLEMQAVAMALGVPAILWMGLASSIASACTAMACFGLCRGVYECNTHASLFDVVEPRARSSAVSAMVMVAFLVGSTSPWLIGRARETLGGFAVPIACLASCYLIGAAAVGWARLVHFKLDRVVE